MFLVFGRLTQEFVIFGKTVINATQSGAGPAEREALQQATVEFRNNSSLGVLRLVIIGIASVFLIYTWLLIWTWTGEVNANRIRAHYLKAILRQDIAYFDSIGQGEGEYPHFFDKTFGFIYHVRSGHSYPEQYSLGSPRNSGKGPSDCSLDRRICGWLRCRILSIMETRVGHDGHLPLYCDHGCPHE
jgi:hypothetical protein